MIGQSLIWGRGLADGQLIKIEIMEIITCCCRHVGQMFIITCSTPSLQYNIVGNLLTLHCVQSGCTLT